jgi:hypothetical protein
VRHSIARHGGARWQCRAPCCPELPGVDDPTPGCYQHAGPPLARCLSVPARRRIRWRRKEEVGKWSAARVGKDPQHFQIGGQSISFAHVGIQRSAPWRRLSLGRTHWLGGPAETVARPTSPAAMRRNQSGTLSLTVRRSRRIGLATRIRARDYSNWGRIPSRRATSLASARLLAPSLDRMDAMWFSTVRGERKSRLAISGLP